MSKERWIFLAILMLAATLRFIGLTSSPPGPIPDEISNAIDARFLAESGRDHHGARWPVYLRGFNDYREATFVYLTVPFVSFIEPWIALRLMAALIGVATVATTYAAAHRIGNTSIASWTALFLAIDPQHILWSRLGMEVILVPFAVSLAWLALLHLDSGGRFGPLLFATSLILTLYSGMMGKPAAAIVALASLTRLPQLLRVARKIPFEVLLALALLGAAAIPAIWSATDQSGRGRFTQIAVSAPTWLGYLHAVTRNYATYWSPQYLALPHVMAFSPAQAMPHLPSTGKMSAVEWLALLAGILTLLFAKMVPFRSALIVFVLLAALPAAFTNTIAPSRVLFALPILTILMGIGIDRITEFLGRRWSTLLVVFWCLVSAAITAGDLTWRAKPWLDAFFWCDQQRILQEFVLHPAETRIVDSRLPFVFEHVIHATNSSADDVLGATPHLNGVLVLPLDQIKPPPGALIATWRDNKTPGCTTLSADGRFKIVRKDSN